MKVLVVEEEKNTVEKLQEILQSIDTTIRIVGSVASISATIDWLQQNIVPDLILVNETLVASHSAQNFFEKEFKAVVTFSTRATDYRFEAFRFNNLPHLLPEFPALQWQKLRNLHRSKKEFSATTPPSAKKMQYRERFLVRQGQKFMSVQVEDIAYFFSEDRFIFFKTNDNQKFLVEYRMEELEPILDPAKFFRVNRSYLISINAVQQIHPYFGNRFKLFLNPVADKDVIVSRERVTDFKMWLVE